MATVYKQSDLQAALDAFKKQPSKAKAAESLGIPTTTFKMRLTEAQRRVKGLPAGTPVPMSEDERKYHADWTAEDCIRHLQDIALAQPNRVITRNHFRVNSDISESTWNRFFGTFEEFKRQAGIKLTRHQHGLERDLAKHASVDRMREITLEKHNWGDAYLRPDSKRYQTVLVGSDLHDIECDPFWRYLFLDTAKRVQPAKVVLNGDIFDLPEFGRFTQDPREWNVVGRIKWVHKFLEDLREACPDTEILFLEGNHEYRLLRHLAEASPALRAVLSDLHGLTVPDLLGLTKFEINYVAPADLATFTKAEATAELKRNWTVLYNFLIAHHYPEGFKMGLPGWNGHHHKHLVWRGFNPDQGSYEWHQLGGGHKQNATYCNAEFWSLGFALVHVDTQRLRAQFEYIDIHDHCVIGGRWYRRTKETTRKSL